MLTDADRQRIRAEEEERFRVRRHLEAPPPQGWSTQSVCCSIVAVLGVIAVISIIALGNVLHSLPVGNEHNSDGGSAAQMAEGFVKQRLKAPSTAVFSNFISEDTVTEIGNGKFTVTGWVDSENSFGAKIRSNWKCTLHTADGRTWSGDSVVIDDR